MGGWKPERGLKFPTLAIWNGFPIGRLGEGLWCWLLVRTLGDSTEKAKGFRQGLPPRWSSGATASVKALENGSWEPGQGNSGLQSLEREVDDFPFSCIVGPRVSEADHFRVLELLQRGHRSPRPGEVGTKEGHFGEQCASNEGRLV